MVYQSLRDWIEKLEEEGLLKRITAEVDWNLELGAIARRTADEEGPALCRGPRPAFDDLDLVVELCPQLEMTRSGACAQ